MTDKLNVPYIKSPTIVNNNGFWCQWCCDCNLRHIYFFQVERGKTPKDDKIVMYLERDCWATLAMKKIIKKGGEKCK